MAMEFHKISHRYERDQVLHEITLSAKRGEVTCLLGPSGCGKTTLLRLAAGLLPVQSGRVVLDDDCLAEPGNSIPPEKRPVGLVFQEGALFPHLDVSANVAFGLNGSASEKKTRVADLLPKVGLEGFEDRYPHTLSGGQQQRVALARALAPSPGVLLLDEPFANIDSQLRQDLRETTRRILKESDTVILLVTHDPEEALEMADHIVVMDKGRIVQTGTPEDLFSRPATAEIATMFGRGQSVKATLNGGHLETPFGQWPKTCLENNPGKGKALKLIVSPDALKPGTSKGTLPIVDLRRTGAEQLLFVEGERGETLRVQTDGAKAFKVGEKISLKPGAKTVLAFPRA